MFQVLFREELSETMESLDGQGVSYLLELNEQMAIRDSVKASWDKTANKD